MDNRICPACTRPFEPRSMLNVWPVWEMHITATANNIHEPTSTWATNPKMCVFRPPGASPKTCHITATASPLSTNKWNWHPAGLNFQTIVFRSSNDQVWKCHITFTRVRFRVLGYGYHRNSIIVVSRPRNDIVVFQISNFKFQISNFKFQISNFKFQI